MEIFNLNFLIVVVQKVAKIAVDSLKTFLMGFSRIKNIRAVSLPRRMRLFGLLASFEAL